MFGDQLVEREMLDCYAPSSPPSSWTAGRAEELFWGARYIDDAVARRQSSSFDGSAESISVTWNDLEWYLTDAQFSVVGRVDIGALVLERVRYDPYGNAQHIDAGDFNGNGQVSVQDIFDWLAVYLAATPPPKPLTADFNRDGAVGTQDNFDYQFLFFGPGPDATEGSVSSADIANGGSDSVVGYCGYVFNHETSDYTVRFRHYSPNLGRWLERDPAGYVEGMSQYEYASSYQFATDPFGLISGRIHHTYPLYLGGSETQECIDVGTKDAHKAAHKSIDDDIEKWAQDQGLTRTKGDKTRDFQR